MVGWALCSCRATKLLNFLLPTIRGRTNNAQASRASSRVEANLMPNQIISACQLKESISRITNNQSIQSNNYCTSKSRKEIFLIIKIPTAMYKQIHSRNWRPGRSLALIFRFLAAFVESSLHPECVRDKKAGETTNCVNWTLVKILQSGHKLHNLNVEWGATSAQLLLGHEITTITKLQQ